MSTASPSSVPESPIAPDPARADAPAVDFDGARSEAFAERMIGALNEAALVAMTSVGHRTGLFDALRGRPAATSAEIAAAAGLQERYVREWLAGMVTARVVEYEPESERYRLPDEHAAWLTRAASPDNLAVTAQMLPCIGGVETALVECFRRGGGVSYAQYERFHEVMAEDSGQTVVAALFDGILPLVPGLAERLEAGIRVLDVGCGSGRALLALAERFPASRFAGIDLCPEPITWARGQAAERGLANVVFEQRDVAAGALGGRFDCITAFDAVHDQRDPAGLLAAIAGALAPDGVFLMQDIAGSSRLERNLEHPIAPLLYAISTAHCMTVSLAQGGEGLGTMWGEERAAEMLAVAGFGRVETKRLPHDLFNVYYVARLGAGV